MANLEPRARLRERFATGLIANAQKRRRRLGGSARLMKPSPAKPKVFSGKHTSDST